MNSRVRIRIAAVAIVSLAVALSFASRAWSDAGGAAIESAAACPAVGCVASSSGDFCLCKSGVDVCAGERMVEACAIANATCCLSAGTCYCSTDARCADGDVPTDRCDAARSASGPRCDLR
jgi:hypothetical protein